MKKVFGFAIAAVVLTMASSCSKSSSTTSSSFSFKGSSYNVVVNGASGSLVASNGSATTPASVTVSFNGGTFPTANVTDTVVYVTSGTNQVSITTNIGTNSYHSTGGSGRNETVAVTVSGGKVAVSGSGIEMVNTLSPSDSSTLTLNISQ